MNLKLVCIFFILSLGETFFPIHWIPVQNYWFLNIKLFYDVFPCLYNAGFDSKILVMMFAFISIRYIEL